LNTGTQYHNYIINFQSADICLIYATVLQNQKLNTACRHEIDKVGLGDTVLFEKVS